MRVRPTLPEGLVDGGVASGEDTTVGECKLADAVAGDKEWQEDNIGNKTVSSLAKPGCGA
jgi:hypothetical protein